MDEDDDWKSAGEFAAELIEKTRTAHDQRKTKPRGNGRAAGTDDVVKAKLAGSMFERAGQEARFRDTDTAREP